MTCGVFAPIFCLFAFYFVLLRCFFVLPFSLCPALLWLSFVVLFLGLSCVFFFPCGLHAKRKGAKCFLCVLSCPVVGGLLYLRIAAAFLSATAAALWHSWSEPKNGGMCGNSGIKTIKQPLKGCFSIFANLNDFITWKFFLSPFRFICLVPPRVCRGLY